MAQQTVGPGPSNLRAPTEKRQYVASTTIAKGDVVTFSGTTGYTVAPCSNILPPIGVAAEGATAGQWFDVIISGFCDYLTCTATDVDAYDMLYAVAGADCDGIPYGTDVGVQGGGIFGMALEAQTGTTITAAHIFKRV